MVARQSGEDFFKRIYRILCRRPAGLGIQAGELILSILLDTRPSLTFPLVVMGIEPGATRTRSATLRPCELDKADVTSRLIAPSLAIAS